MSAIKRKSGAVGVIVARFQVSKLHAGHRHLIDYVRARHSDVLIVLGVHGGVRTKKDPLTFIERAVMVRQTICRKLTIRPLNDNPISHLFWSRNLDALIKKEFPGRDAVLYGSRDSFIGQYLQYDARAFSTHEVAMAFVDSGTERRAKIREVKSEAGRAAIIYSEGKRPDFVYSASDLAITNRLSGEVLLAGKNAHEGFLSFMGGHAEKSDGDALTTALRERREEIRGIEVGEAVHIGNLIINDPRYRGTNDAVMSALFEAPYLAGTPTPGDDVDFVRWVKREELPNVLVKWHQPSGALLNEHWD